MLNHRELATVLAALFYWREEMCPHGQAIIRPYFKAVGFPRANPLTADEVAALSKRLVTESRD